MDDEEEEVYYNTPYRRVISSANTIMVNSNNGIFHICAVICTSKCVATTIVALAPANTTAARVNVAMLLVGYRSKCKPCRPLLPGMGLGNYYSLRGLAAENVVTQ
ncbi:MAG TPA: hypothetical protein VJ695_02525 [Nitrososphaera sp.]|nr:hypothetical protein [Nitrososphaera sp.]